MLPAEHVANPSRQGVRRPRHPFLRARRKRPENLGAYDLYLRALPHTQSAMPEDAAIAIGRAGRGSWARGAQAAEMCGRAFSVLDLRRRRRLPFDGWLQQ